MNTIYDIRRLSSYAALFALCNVYTLGVSLNQRNGLRYNKKPQVRQGTGQREDIMKYSEFLKLAESKREEIVEALKEQFISAAKTMRNDSRYEAVMLWDDGEVECLSFGMNESLFAERESRCIRVGSFQWNNPLDGNFGETNNWLNEDEYKKFLAWCEENEEEDTWDSLLRWDREIYDRIEKEATQEYLDECAVEAADVKFDEFIANCKESADCYGNQA